MTSDELDRAELGDRVAGALAEENGTGTVLHDLAVLLRTAVRTAPASLDTALTPVTDRLGLTPADTVACTRMRLEQALAFEPPPGRTSAPAVIIRLAATGTYGGHLLAVIPSGSLWYSAERLLVGDYLRVAPDRWKAWLWPAPGGAMHISRACETIERPCEDTLAWAVRERARKSTWWTGN